MHRPRADTHPTGNLYVREPTSDQLDNLSLTSSQSGSLIWPATTDSLSSNYASQATEKPVKGTARPRVPAHGLDYPGVRRFVKPRFLHRDVESLGVPFDPELAGPGHKAQQG
jgi:hypothetical protein